MPAHDPGMKVSSRNLLLDMFFSAQSVQELSNNKPAADAAAAAPCAAAKPLRHTAMQIVKWIVSLALVALAIVMAMYAALGFEENTLLNTMWYDYAATTNNTAPSNHHLLVPPSSPAPKAATGGAAAAAGSGLEKELNQAEVLQQQQEQEDCAGRYIHIYALPELFNSALIEEYCDGRTIWPTVCNTLINKGLGDPIVSSVATAQELWYQTDQFALEVMVHERMKLYECLTEDPSLASALYLPYYVGLDVARNLFNPLVQVRDKLSLKFVGWLLAQPEWRRRQGSDHVLVLGRVVWDFLRKDATNEWGIAMLRDPELGNMTKLLIERNPYAPNTKMIGIPYPTSFHPETDADVEAWQTVVTESSRDNLVSFAGAPRKVEFNGKLRGTLLHQCMESENCTLLDCSKISCPKNPQYVTGLFLRSVFCLQPPGDSPTRKGIFDCLVAGCIPVFFSNDSAYAQYLWHLPRNGSSYSVFINENQVQDNGDNVIEMLASISSTRVKKMQQTIVGMIPGLVYAKPGYKRMEFKDAFDIIIDHVLGKSGSASPPHLESDGQDHN
ncbi:unnamed protein product [Sphagnum jensenii]|uniref:Exostosin GT47 domain-containing protein n=1 Tax=Sphagnum jensenii TaxID=128206 RepID=A0ABP1ANS5_9BRYO